MQTRFDKQFDIKLVSLKRTKSDPTLLYPAALSQLFMLLPRYPPSKKPRDYGEPIHSDNKGKSVFCICTRELLVNEITVSKKWNNRIRNEN